MSKRDNGKHGADNIPADKLDEVKRLVYQGDRAGASDLLHKLATKHRLKSYEVFHLAQHLGNSTSIMELRSRFPFKPHDLVTLDGREVEVISYPYPDDPRPVGILVRMTPGDPGTMTAVEAGYLQPAGVGVN